MNDYYRRGTDNQPKPTFDVEIEVPLALTHQHEIARLFRVPDRLVGLRAPWWRDWWQRHVTRRP